MKHRHQGKYKSKSCGRTIFKKKPVHKHRGSNWMDKHITWLEQRKEEQYDKIGNPNWDKRKSIKNLEKDIEYWKKERKNQGAGTSQPPEGKHYITKNGKIVGIVSDYFYR